MTTTRSHAAPWTFARVLAMFAPTQTRTRPMTGLMTGREAAARHLYGQAVRWDAAAMDLYDASPILQGGWLAEADRRIAQPELDLSELIIARWHNYTPAQWLKLPAHVQVAKRDDYAQARGL